MLSDLTTFGREQGHLSIVNVGYPDIGVYVKKTLGQKRDGIRELNAQKKKGSEVCTLAGVDINVHFQKSHKGHIKDHWRDFCLGSSSSR